MLAMNILSYLIIIVCFAKVSAVPAAPHIVPATAVRRRERFRFRFDVTSPAPGLPAGAAMDFDQVDTPLANGSRLANRNCTRIFPAVEPVR